jgi:hypothetical protein
MRWVVGVGLVFGLLVTVVVVLYVRAIWELL